MIASNVPAYNDELLKIGRAALKQAFSKDVEEIFRTLFTEPLSKIEPPDGTPYCVIVIDALDELPADAKNRILRLISENFLDLPKWVRLFVTSRDEEIIKVYLKKFAPYNLLVDEQKNRQDMRAFLRFLASPYFKDLDVAGLKVDIQSKFGASIKDDALRLIGENFRASRRVYDDAMKALEGIDQGGLTKLLEVRDVRPPDLELRQQFSSLSKGLELSKLCHPIVLQVLNGKELSGNLGVEIKDPGLKDLESATRKLNGEYRGEANRLKDLVRFSIIADKPALLLAALEHLQSLPGWKMLSCKNKYASPTPLGYRDLNTCFRVPLDDGFFLCEIQLHLKTMIEVKEQAHVFYENIRVELPKICENVGVDKAQLEAYLKQRIDNSVLDAAVDKMEGKTDGLFVYAKLLGDHIEQVAAQNNGQLTLEDVTALPDGLDDVYQENFSRVFPGGNRWQSYKQLVTLIVAAREPIPVALARQVLKWDKSSEEKTLSDLSLLFPTREGRIHVYHKTVVDWLVDEKRSGETFYLGPEDVVKAHERLSHTCLSLLEDGKDTAEFLKYPLKFVLAHACQARSPKAGMTQSAEIQNLWNRAIDQLLSFAFLYKRAKISPVKLLEDIVALEEVVSASLKKESDRQRALSLLRSGIRLSMQGLIYDFR